MNDPKSRETSRVEELRQENETLAQQVKGLVKAEGKLYEYQERLDIQLKEYKTLYELNRKINTTFDIGAIFGYALEYVIRDLGYERVLFLRQCEDSGDYAVCARDGFYDPEELAAVENLAIGSRDPFIHPLLEGREYLICEADSEDSGGFRGRLGMQEYLLYPLGSQSPPLALLAVGNSAENAEFYRRIRDREEALLGMGNLVGLLSSRVDNYASYQSMKDALEQRKRAESALQHLNEELEQRVVTRTSELEQANTGLRKLTEDLEAAFRELKSAQSRILQQEKMASIGQLAAGVAHEINNPMGFIISNLNSFNKYTEKITSFMQIQAEALETLENECCARDVAENLQKQKRLLKLDYVLEDLGLLIEESMEGAERVKRIVQNLKSFSRVDETAFKPADINAGLESTINMVWNEIKYKATLNRDLGALPEVYCNLGQLNQVFMNLLVNAAHAITDQGQITVRTACDGKNVSISISDTGKGIPAENLGRIFEPFFTTKEVGQGTGLGLSIAYDIVKQHNGEILVDSEVGKGTTFTVSIPIKDQSAAP